MNNILFQPGTLSVATEERTAQALDSGHLQPVNITREVHHHDGLPYLYHVLQGRDKKVEDLITHKKKEKLDGKKHNPFLPYEKEMEVAPFTQNHALLLNKFPVIEHHLLAVTRDYAHQDRLLTFEDFHAMWALLAELDGCVFYNGGAAAGASQHHKHLQWIPLPMAGPEIYLPIEPLLVCGTPNELTCAPPLPFAHLIAAMDPAARQHLSKTIPETYQLYLSMLRRLGCYGGFGDPGAYNLLATRKWMLIVPRSNEFYQGISVNSLGFLGSVFVRNRSQLTQVQEMGPLQLLSKVCYPR